MVKTKDITGLTFGKLTALKLHHIKKHLTVHAIIGFLNVIAVENVLLISNMP